MRVGIAIWQSRVSPVFDVAGRLLVVEVEKGREVARKEESIVDPFPPRKAQRLRELDVEVLICGAISRPLAELVVRAGVTVLPWIAGDAEEVLRCYLEGQLPDPRFVMPGGRWCWRAGWRRGRCWGGPPHGRPPFELSSFSAQSDRDRSRQDRSTSDGHESRRT